eukprot:3735510-Pleurochrysis_carterae.AAC.1
MRRDKHNSAGVIQAEKALRALEHTGGQTYQGVREDEERALRQMISGIIPEWQEASNRRGGARPTKIMRLK